MSGLDLSGLDRARLEVRRRMEEAQGELLARELPEVALRGKLLRPLVAYAAVPPSERPAREFWMGALAVQMVHEASLLHDDILDDGSVRRGRPSDVSKDGIARALVSGDHLLTAAYRVAHQAGSPGFMTLFTEAAEQTVAGEMAQGRSAGLWLDEGTYLQNLEKKSGALFGCSLALGPSLRSQEDVQSHVELGRRLGRLYQLLDDVLDYCPASLRGKPPFQDYSQEKWTLPLSALEETGFGSTVHEIHARLFRSAGREGSPMRRILERLRGEIQGVREDHEALSPWDRIIPELLERWEAQLERAVEREERTVDARGVLANEVGSLDSPGAWSQYFGRHATTFSFAARLIPTPADEQIAGVYAFCRFSDDLVDGSSHLPTLERRRRLEAWRILARSAHCGRTTGIALLDRVLGDSGRAGVPFPVVEALLEGLDWDLERREYASMDELREYTYRVAGTVGEWLTWLLGCGDEPILARARSLGHAMQLTNILRDVGEDYRMGRVYLPSDRMDAWGVETDELTAMLEGRRPPSPSYRGLIEELIREADRAYDLAVEGVPALPRGVRESVSVAARAYQGIHREIRRNGYDNLTRRAATGLPRKLMLAGGALWELSRIQRRNRRRATRFSTVETPGGFLRSPCRAEAPA